MSFFLGLDFGTSGARACVLDEAGETVFESRVAYADAASPKAWRDALFGLLDRLPPEIRARLSAIAIAGTSGTLLATDAAFEPDGPALLYNDARAAKEAKAIDNPRYGPTSGLAKRLWLAAHHPDAAFCFHQADWLAALLTGKAGITDYHNALKSGYDVEKLAWPDWVGRLPGAHWQQKVLTPGEAIGPPAPATVRRFALNPACIVRAGTTDSIAAFIAAGAHEPGDAVTSLGTTLVLKLLSETRVDDAASGVYSHRFGRLWLAGGASNSGGGVLKQYFGETDLARLSAGINPERPGALDYYPLPAPGERFPINDPQLPPRLSPRPQNDADFLQGLLEGMARIEALGYRRLMELGASPVKRVLTAGGGAQNPAWWRIRRRVLQLPVAVATHAEAAHGAALLAHKGPVLFPV
ncbi:MAG: FGGY-family carbohydrate kinase [Pseudomonadota bacterium]